MILAVTFELALAVKLLTVVPFFWIVSVALFTVGIVGVPVKSEYRPDVATVAKLDVSAFAPKAVFKSVWSDSVPVISPHSTELIPPAEAFVYGRIMPSLYQ